MRPLPVKIIGSAVAMPPAAASALLDERLGLPKGTVFKTGGVVSRHIAPLALPQSALAAQAVLAALRDAGLGLHQMDALVAAFGVPEQAIPCNAVLVARELGLADAGVATFDVNATCLSFLVGLDALAAQIAVQRFKTVVLVSCDLASRGIDWAHLESASILGDGAAAVVLQYDDTGASQILATHVASFPQGWDACQIKAGGTAVNPRTYGDDLTEQEFLFQMDGRAVFKLAAEKVPQVLAQFWQRSGLSMADVDWVVPHQASHLGLQHMRKLLNVPAEKIIDIYATHGNQVAASLPCALHAGIADQRIQRGDTVLLVGTGAGLTVGLLALKF
ncbi:MAG: 3-oxoacyl-[acyl-carrier-protein] synthase III C-terminal domain-containing protein [Formosimonas sp.]